MQEPTRVVARNVVDAVNAQYAVFTGGHDREFRSLIVFPDLGLERIPDSDYVLLMKYFSSLSSTHASVRSFVIVIDRRTGTWTSVKQLVDQINDFFPASLEQIYVLKPQGLLQRLFIEKTMAWIRDGCKYEISFLDSVTELSPFIEIGHLPTNIGGELSFNTETWLKDRMSIEDFRRTVDDVCNRGQLLIASLGHSVSDSCSLTISDVDLQSTLYLNAPYLPPVVNELRRRRRQWLSSVAECETEGLQLRSGLRDTKDIEESEAAKLCRDNESDYSSLPRKGKNCQCDSDAPHWAHQGVAFDLPVDRVFHVINLEHILVRLTEARSRFNAAWKLFIRRANIAKLIGEIELRFNELQPLKSIWENLIESSLDYQPVRSSPQTESDISAPTYFSNGTKNRLQKSASVSDVPLSEKANTIPPDISGDTMNLEGLEAVVSRLTEAEQFATRLLPELQALSRSSSKLISSLSTGDSPTGSIDLDWTEIGTLTNFTFQLEDESDVDHPTTPAALERLECLSKLQLPALQLPLDAEKWPILFRQLAKLAQTNLPKVVDQLSRLLQLYAEISQARIWIERGRKLVEDATPSEKLASWSLPECRTRLQELTSLCVSRESTIQLLTDPKLFHSRFALIVNTELRSTLKELLREVEDVERMCQVAIASIRQHISRASFPRHQHSSTSLSPQSSGTETPQGSHKSPTKGYLEQQQDADDTAVSQSEQSAATLNPARRFQLAWDELVDTERGYVNFLQHVYDVVWLADTAGSDKSQQQQQQSKESISSVPVPPFMRDNQNWLLVNWPELLCFHRDTLLPSLEQCSGDVTKLSQWAQQMLPRLIDLYSTYCSTYESAVQIAVQLERDRLYSPWVQACSAQVHERELRLSMKNAPVDDTAVQDVPPTAPEPVRPVLQLSARLLSPVQRFQRYHLLLDRLERLALTEVDKAELSNAHKTMLLMCETVNLTMRFRGLSIRPSDLGKLLLRADFSISRVDSRSSQQRHVFLFTNAILLTKFRTSAATYTGSSGAILSGDFSSSDSRDRAGSNHSLSGTALHPLVSNLASLAKSHGLVGSDTSLLGSGSSLHESGSVYEIKQELLLAQIGLTPSVRSDRRRFAVWTANRAQTYIFQSADANLRDQWVRSINDLLMAQLRRLRDEASQRYKPSRIAVPRSPSSPGDRQQSNRSCSLTVPLDAEFSKTRAHNGSLKSLPSAAGSRKHS
ncbi:unnamed protein product [Calicophoron daubneyi]|uniref:Guanine nucleotide exchange factor DBS n=1 Tax=Calicophoron daubneyi TaxID=300641 RepID=A0AAV2T733_CALDB